MAVLLAGSNLGCLFGSSEADAPDAATDAPALAADGPTTSPADVSYALDAPPGPPVSLTLDKPQPFDLGNHCGRTAVYFDAAHTDTYTLGVTSGGNVNSTSTTLNMVNASVYCTFTLPAGSKSVLFHRGVAHVKIDPGNGAAIASGGGLGFLIYFGANTPRDGVTWGNYGTSALASWKDTRPYWNVDLPADDLAVAVPAGATTATFALYIVDAWGLLPVDGDVTGVAVEASSAATNGDAGAGQ